MRFILPTIQIIHFWLHSNLSFITISWFYHVLSYTWSIDGKTVFLIDVSKLNIGLNSIEVHQLIRIINILMIVQLDWNLFNFSFGVSLRCYQVVELIFQWIDWNLRSEAKNLFEFKMAF